MLVSSIPRRSFLAGAALAGLVAALCVLVPGCAKKTITLPFVAQHGPSLELSQAPVSSTTPYFYSSEIFWTSFDPDGRVEYYLYTLDPPSGANAETTWVRTTENRKTFSFRSDDPDHNGTLANPGGHHVFAIRAVDNDGNPSPTLAQAFFSYTVAPTVIFIRPRARSILPAVLAPTSTFVWTGTDPDGQRTRRPVQYKYKLFPEDSQDFEWFYLQYVPDSLRHYYAPAFAGWDSIAGDTCQVTIERMIPNKSYAFVVVAFDEAGAYSPVFNFDHNMVNFTCSLVGNFGPKLRLWSDFFDYSYLTGGYNTDPATFLKIEVPAERVLQFNWVATPENNRVIKQYRWAVDIERLEDNSARTDERTDWKHWSRWSLVNVSARVGPFEGREGEFHVLYVEAEDAGGFTSLGAVQFQVIKPTFQRDLLFVDDARRAVDQRSVTRSDSVLAPGGPWPSRAELDTFFFARGGKRWRSYPTGSLSPPGVFNGYAFDTVATRNFQGGLVPLAVLGRYRHVVWSTDWARDYVEQPGFRLQMTQLRIASTAGLANSIAVYSALGGKVWMMGGGAAYNSLIFGNVTINDQGQQTVFSNVKGELVPGRLPYDFAHWTSQITLGTPSGAVRNPALEGRWAGAPDYSQLPAELVGRTPELDPQPPLRAPATYYQYTYEGEGITKENEVLEDMDPDPSIDRMEPALDTLYFAYGSATLDGMPIMTYYHGNKHAPFLFSGFPLWYFTRSQGIELADFVLQRMWGLQRAPVSRAPRP
jgi:hypothetical protein